MTLPIFDIFKRIPDSTRIQEYSDWFMQAKHLVFMPTKETIHLSESEIEDSLDLPFPIVTFSMAKKNSFITAPEPGAEQVYITSLLVKELSPCTYSIYISCLVDVEEGTEHRTVKIEKESESYDFTFRLCKTFIDRLNDKKSERAKVKERFVHKVNGTTKRIRSFVLVADKESKDRASTELGRNINWSHSWNVRGHWRRVKGFGHDRGGEPIQGYTWVRPHIKGEGELVNKTYIVKGSV